MSRNPVAAVAQVDDDLRAWVGTLDLAETAGELEHLGRSVSRALEAAGSGTVNPASVGMTVVASGQVFTHLTRRLAELTAVSPASHRAELHSCEFVRRLLWASR